ncbi:conserved hypothetical protein [Candidatus Jettenia caeni]|uniref:Uncharacterized protein n=2 Tax=Candidatus Jettenia TaxID=360731 RepID=I3IN53_9BACT|nr:MAG: hypothetical protein EDM77_02200 [Candidatus Jettenia sp. AMX1]MCE7879329.1 hypothetical protein [Candidatus Jettenia sp. AMX1]MCQ3927447.1 hypothetical protein [Candidatus Jettenia sp.]GAB63148.1 conserved hypothetical protein [Candidatus Jettenia caeni]
MEWKINRGSKGCIMCDKKFSDDEEYYSALFDENNAFTRKDFCIACWDKDKQEHLFSFWKTKVPKKDKPVQRFISTEVLLDMFIRLEGSSEIHQRNLRYVLALYLIRKKLFKVRSFHKQNEEEYIILYYPKEDREFNVFNPDLKEEEIESITSEMSQLLNYPYLEQTSDVK